MPLLTLSKIHLALGGPPLLDGVDLAIEAGERICVVGRNGAGKSTLLRLLAGEIQADDGQMAIADGLRIRSMAQEVPVALAGSCYDVLADGAGQTGSWLAAYHHASHAQDVDTVELARLHERIEAVSGWTLGQRIEAALQELGLDPEQDFASLSGGMKRRLMLAGALLEGPGLLLLDEPTNHLDIEAIGWMERFLRDYAGTVIFVTHDRAFLQALATRIIEIDRGQLSSWPGDYANYLRRREERAHAEAQHRAAFDRKLAEEEVWIRQGIKARRTRNEGRVRALQALRRERAQRREAPGRARIEVQQAGQSGRRVLRAEGLGLSLGGRRLVEDFSTTILRGDRVGIVGRNGSGKTTLLRLLLGEIPPEQGEVELGSGLQIAYFDQQRAQLREDWSALENVAEGQEYLQIGERRVHALGYLQDFLFSPERARAPITRLSGGERNRLLLARLFARPSNLLVLDEPTNDLDVETLELLEEQLTDYAGTVLLVSHDRAFLDAVVSSLLLLDGSGRVEEFVGGYSDWERHRQTHQAATVAPAAKPARPPKEDPPPATRRKLGFKEQRELEQLPARIEALEATIAELSAAMQEPAFFQRPAAAIIADQQQLATLQQELEAAYARWESLES